MTEFQGKVVTHIKEYINDKECMLHNLEQEAVGASIFQRPTYEALIEYVNTDIEFGKLCLRSYLHELGLTEEDTQSLIF